MRGELNPRARIVGIRITHSMARARANINDISLSLEAMTVLEFEARIAAPGDRPRSPPAGAHLY